MQDQRSAAAVVEEILNSGITKNADILRIASSKFGKIVTPGNLNQIKTKWNKKTPEERAASSRTSDFNQTMFEEADDSRPVGRPTGTATVPAAPVGRPTGTAGQIDTGYDARAIQLERDALKLALKVGSIEETIELLKSLQN